MKYKLKKELTRYDLVNTKWKLDSPEKSNILHDKAVEWGFKENNMARGKGQLYFDVDSNIGYMVDFEADYFNSVSDKEMKFNDWFEEDKAKIIDGEERLGKVTGCGKRFEEYKLKCRTYVNHSGYDYTVLCDDCKKLSKKRLVKNKPEEGSFLWAIESGEKIRKPNWKEGNYIYVSHSGRIKFKDGTSATLFKEQIKATDWEIYEEENKFGDFRILKRSGDAICIDAKKINSNFKIGFRTDDTPEIYIKKSQLDDLERAIKRAREIK